MRIKRSVKEFRKIDVKLNEPAIFLPVENELLFQISLSGKAGVEHGIAASKAQISLQTEATVRVLPQQGVILPHKGEAVIQMKAVHRAPSFQC